MRDWKKIITRLNNLLNIPEEEKSDDDDEIEVASLDMFIRFLVKNDVINNPESIAICPGGDIYAQWRNEDAKASIRFLPKQGYCFVVLGATPTSGILKEHIVVQRLCQLNF